MAPAQSRKAGVLVRCTIRLEKRLHYSLREALMGPNLTMQCINGVSLKVLDSMIVRIVLKVSYHCIK